MANVRCPYPPQKDALGREAEGLAHISFSLSWAKT